MKPDPLRSPEAIPPTSSAASDALARYHRQMLLPDLGRPGQERLAAAHVLVIGCGALGTVVLDSLARAGVGTLTFVDRDLVELTNLQRQTLYDERDARDLTPKAVAAGARLASVNSGIDLRPVIADVHAANIEELLRPAHIVIDCTDNFQTRYLINDACVKHARPWVYAGAVGTRAMQATFLPRAREGAARTTLDASSRPCLRCVFPEPPPPGSSPTCDTVGVLGPVVGLVACFQAVEALKLLLGREDLVSPALLELDPWRGEHRRIDLSRARDPDCPCCAHARYEFLEGPRAAAAARGGSAESVLCGQNAVQITGSAPTGRSGVPGVDLAVIGDRLARVARVERNRWFLRVRVEEDRYLLTVFPDGRTIVHGTTDTALARSLHARYIGA